MRDDISFRLYKKTGALRQPTKGSKSKDKVRKTHHHGKLQVDLHQLLSKPNLPLGVSKLLGQVRELRHRGMPLLPKDLPELTLPGIPKDKPRLCFVLRAGPL